MGFSQDIAINTLWYSSTGSEAPDSSDPLLANVVNGAVAVNTADGLMWVKVTGGDVSGGWKAVGASIVTPVTVGLGGTGAQTLTANGVLIGNGTSNVTAVDLSTKGYLLAGDGSGNPRALPVGGTNGHVLTVASGQATGLQWAAAPAAGSVTGSGNSGKFAYWTGSTTLDDAATGSSAYLYNTGNYTTGSAIYFTGLSTGTGDEIVIYNNLIKRVASSQRYKENIVNLTIDSARIYNLVPRNFKWRDTQEPVITDGQVTDTMQTVTGANDFGLIAEEVHAILPELVTYNASSQPETVKYRYLSVLLLAELKKLKARVAVLEAG